PALDFALVGLLIGLVLQDLVRVLDFHQPQAEFLRPGRPLLLQHVELKVALLVLGVRRGDAGAWSRLVERHRLYSVALRAGKEEVAAEAGIAASTTISTKGR